jgi:hypothetical protein
MKDEPHLAPPNFSYTPLGVIIVRSDQDHPWRFEFTNGPPTRKQYFRERFMQVATDAGIHLGTRPRGATPLAFWLDRLYKHCLENCTESVFAKQIDTGGGSLKRICEASATYCAWLDRITLEREDATTTTTIPAEPKPEPEPTCAQLERLRVEAHISIEDLAAAIDTDPRSVYRHLSGERLPQPKYLAKYQRVFSERLDRKVHIKKLSGKCH